VQEEDKENRRHGVVVQDEGILEALAIFELARPDHTTDAETAKVHTFERVSARPQLVKLSLSNRKIIILDNEKAEMKKEKLDEMEKELGRLLGF